MYICMPKSWVCKKIRINALSTFEQKRKKKLSCEWFVLPQESNFCEICISFVTNLERDEGKSAQLLTHTVAAFLILHTTLPFFMPMWRQLAKFEHRAQK